MPVVAPIAGVAALTGQMADLGYEAIGEYRIPGRRYCRKRGDRQNCNLHVFGQTNALAIDRHLAVRDHLRRHPDAAARYGELKAGLSRQFADDIDAYMDGKHDFLQASQQTALAWCRNR